MKKNRPQRSLIYDSSHPCKYLLSRYTEKKSFFSCVIHIDNGEKGKESIDLIPKAKITIEQMIDIVRHQFLEPQEEDGGKISFRIYSQRNRPK